MAVVVLVVSVAVPVGAQSESVGAPGVGGFSDVSGVHGPAVAALGASGVFEGTLCGGGLFCPGEALPRWVMAVWLVRVLDGADPARAGGSRFVDVDASLWWSAHTERLAEVGVTRGCRVEPLRFCPHGPVTRAQMAAFLVLNRPGIPGGS